MALVYTAVIAPDLSVGLKGQTEQALEQLDRNLAEAGTDRTRLLSVTIYLTDISKKPILNQVWDAWIGTGELASASLRGGEARGRYRGRDRRRGSEVGRREPEASPAA